MTRKIDYTLNEGDVIVHYHYQNAEKQTHDHEGCEEDIVIECVFFDSVDIFRTVSDIDFEKMQTFIFEYLKDVAEFQGI